MRRPLTRTVPLRRNDPRQYDALADQWWRPNGTFAMLHWLAAARAQLIPAPSRAGALLVDVGCGAGLLAPHVAGKGYRHVGLDITHSALVQAVAHGVTAVRADAARLPLPDGIADVVVAGEILEHLPDRDRAVAELSRILRPDGVLVLDTLNDTALSRLLAIRLAERVPAVPRGLHDPALLVDPAQLTAQFARHGVRLQVRGVRPTVWPMLRWAATGRGAARIVPTWTTAVLYQGYGGKDAHVVAPWS